MREIRTSGLTRGEEVVLRHRLLSYSTATHEVPHCAGGFGYSPLKAHGQKSPDRGYPFFDRALRTVKEYMETVEYLPINPVRRGLVKHAEEWKVSGVSDYAGAALALLVTCH